MTQKTSLTGTGFCTQLLFSQVELENGLNLTSQISPINTLFISSITRSYLKLSYSLCLVSTSLFITHYTKWVVDLPSFPSFEWDFFIIDSPKGEDLILGYDFLYHFNPIIDWKNVLITHDFGHKDSGGITSSTSNAFATAVNSVSLAGELKTPSLPPSVIPSQSLLLSRDEVFKDIKDVVEDVAIS
ncbi:hypothetical protein O181_051703 [Austropuccinia psidii MF-1]|uniref:Uncharacterized protein n=1 Tax=Austropuccinia psidii MF-1 TaxID=1389203 RepID=A0A9Q3HNM3_9BASI|nr:hypothetical protein [Austropuccinia psidii MF-1]